MRFENTLRVCAAAISLAACAAQPAADPRAPAAPTVVYVSAPTQYDGVYVGRPVTGSGCRDVNRDFSLVVENGRASMVYALTWGFQLTGYVNEEGVVRMTGNNGPYQFVFEGKIVGTEVKATSSDTGSTCPVTFAMKRQ